MPKAKTKRRLGRKPIPITHPLPYKVDELLFWHPIPKLQGTHPWGYYEDDKINPDLYLPNHEKLRLLEVAKKLISKGHSLREVSRWLSAESGETITHTGLRLRIDNEKRTSKKSNLLRQICIRYDTAYKAWRKYEAQKYQYHPVKGRREADGSITNPLKEIRSAALAAEESEHSPGKPSPCCPTCGKRGYIPT